MIIPKHTPNIQTLKSLTALHPCMREAGNVEHSAHPYTQELSTARLFKYHSLASTQTLLRDHANTFFQSGDVVCADQQTNGRGRGHHTWSSKSGYSLTFSLLLQRNNHREHVFYTQLVALALARGLESFNHSTSNTSEKVVSDKGTSTDSHGTNHPVRPTHPMPIHCALKWPNDILIHGKKVAGVLIDTTPVKHSLEQINLIIGVGLNALESHELLAQYHPQDSEHSYPITSFYNETGQSISLSRHLRVFLCEFFKLEALFLMDVRESLIADWRKRSQFIGKILKLDVQHTPQSAFWGTWQVQAVSASGIVTLSSLVTERQTEETPSMQSTAHPYHPHLRTISLKLEELGF